MSRRKISKIVVLGDSAVGKTSILNSFCEQRFGQSHKATVGADFKEKEVFVEGKGIILEIWDTAGQERFRAMGSAFYRGSDCCVLVYDITDANSFKNIESWISEFLNNGAPKEPDNFPFVLIGNKIDMEQQRQVDQLLVREFLLNHPKVKHFQVSAKSGVGIKQAFDIVALASIQNKVEEIYNVIDLTKIKPGKKQKKVCC